MLEGCHNLIEIEGMLRSEVLKISLLGQIALSDEDIRLVRGVVSKEFGTDPSRLERDGQLTFSCLLVWIGVGDYEEGRYWNKVEDVLGKQGPYWQSKWGKLFVDTISRYQLTCFREKKGHQYVAPILLHAGIPDKCLPDFFQHVLDPIVRGEIAPEATGAEEIVFEWRLTPHYGRVGRPVQRFLEDGGKPAADFLDRCVEIVRAFDFGERIQQAEELGIPERVAQELDQWLRDNPDRTRAEGKTVLHRPRVELLTQYGGEVRVLLPEQMIKDQSNGSVSFQAFADGSKVCETVLRSYRRKDGLLTNLATCDLPPAQKYRFCLLLDVVPLREWTMDGVTQDEWIAFNAKGSLIRGSELPRGAFWLGFLGDEDIEGARVLEESSGSQSWERHRFLLLDVTETESLRLTARSGEKIYLPLAAESELIVDEPLPGCSIDGIPIYSGSLPVIRVPLRDSIDVDQWDVIVEDLFGRTARKQIPLREAADHISGTVATVSAKRLFDERPIGHYRVKLRARGALGHDRLFQFAFIREFDCEFDKPFYLAGEPPALTLLAGDGIHVESADSSATVDRHGVECRVSSDPESRFFGLKVRDDEGRSLLLTFEAPRLRWRFRNLAGDSSTGWISTTYEILLEDFESNNDAALIAELPLYDGSIVTLEVEGADQKVPPAKVQRQEARFLLNPFTDTLRHFGMAVVRFCLSFIDRSGAQCRLYPLLVRSRWLVEGFEVSDVRIVSFKWIDKGRFKNRKLRLWNLLRVWEPPREYAICDSASEIDIRESTHLLPPARYRAELILEDDARKEYENPCPIFVPNANHDDVFDIAVGEEDQYEAGLRGLSPFHRCLMRRLAAWERGDAMKDTLDDGDLDDLIKVLVFLVGESRTKEAKLLWFDDLKSQTTDPRIRARMRDRIRGFAQMRDNSLKGILFTLCKTIELAVTSLMPLQEGSKVRVENKVLRYERVVEWKEDPSAGQAQDLLSFLYEDGSKDKKPLGFFDKLVQVDDDTPVDSSGGRQPKIFRMPGRRP